MPQLAIKTFMCNISSTIKFILTILFITNNHTLHL